MERAIHSHFHFVLGTTLDLWHTHEHGQLHQSLLGELMERITQANCVGPARYGHEFRYRLAAGFIGSDDKVLDAACGTGYGYDLLAHTGCSYMGVDRASRDEVELPETLSGTWTCWDPYIQGDLATWRRPPTWDFDVFLGFETIEHLPDYRNYVDIAHQAEKWILASAPAVPTVGANPHHVHDFEPGQLREIFENEEWEHYQTVQQPSELSEIVILRRRA